MPQPHLLAQPATLPEEKQQPQCTQAAAAAIEIV
jgi:hypothetical protein